jgi:hypothetical protein
MRNLPIFLIISLFLLSGCSDEPSYTSRTLYFKAKEFDPTIERVQITDPSKRILCKNYGEGCVEGSGQRVKIRRVEMVVIQFETIKFAKAEALRLGQYHARNWLLDDVATEPVLIDFVTRGLEAKKPQAENK